jgi:hypothetical protein
MKLSKEILALLSASGVPVEAFGAKSGAKANKSIRKRWELNQTVFLAGCKAHGLPEPFFELLFHPKRKWRFDIAWPHDLAVEVQGGLFTGGRHVRGAALLDEYEKLSEAAILGWRVLLVTPKQVDNGEIFSLAKRAMS